MKTVKNPIRIDRENGRILVSKPFLNKANVFGTKEYRMLEEVRTAYPNYEVSGRSINSQGNNSPHKRVSYPFMERYIQSHEHAQKRMKEYLEMRLRAECQMSSFADVKKWFVACYPEIDDFTPEDFKLECENVDGGEGKNDRFKDLLASA